MWLFGEYGGDEMKWWNDVGDGDKEENVGRDRMGMR